MKRWCPRGTQFWNEMDLKLAHAEALVQGKLITGSYLCDHCEAWHLGLPKPLRFRCPLTHKLTFETEQEALEGLRLIAAKREMGFQGRREVRVYECTGKHGCMKWHLTSDEEIRER